MNPKHLILILGLTLLEVVKGDLPCVPRFYPNKSSVCVCNSTYCDTVTRKTPAPGTFITYTSSKSGLRFSKGSGNITAKSLDFKGYNNVLELRPAKTYQTIEGFGGAVTDAAGINWKSLPPAAQQHLINSYCSDQGLEYNMLRVPIASSDFSTHDYSYNEYPKYDKALTNYTLAPEDYNYKIPMIHACQKVAKAELNVVSAVWSPPRWMQSKNKLESVCEEYYQSFADYHCKFAELYKKNGIKIWGLSATNEPLTKMTMKINFTEMAWSMPKMAKFLVKFFGPVIRNCSVKDIKILANDDQRYSIPFLFTQLNEDNSKAIDFIDGIASHFYGDTISPPAVVSYALQEHPTKFIISTEACTGITSVKNAAIDFGSWKRAETYIMDILECLNYNYVGWIDWNMSLDKQGGPNWAENFVDSLIIVDAKEQEFLKQPMFYAFGHFTKFLPRGSKRIKIVTLVPAPDPYQDFEEIELLRQKRFPHVAFVTPTDTIVIIIHNNGPAQKIAVQLGDQQVTLILETDSITTVEIPYDRKTSLFQLCK